MFFEKQISILEGFLKDNTTLKTGVMMLKYLKKRKELFSFEIFHNLSVFTAFFYKINAALVSILTKFENTTKKKKKTVLYISLMNPQLVLMLASPTSVVVG